LETIFQLTDPIKQFLCHSKKMVKIILHYGQKEDFYNSHNVTIGKFDV